MTLPYGEIVKLEAILYSEKWKKCFVPYGACELRREPTKEGTWSSVSSPMGRVSCDTEDEGISKKDAALSSPMGRVSCDLLGSGICITVKKRLSSPMGRVSCDSHRKMT